ncbi:MAG: epoxyqueuosine reductase [Desulfobacteraceae bacterium]|nr:epoxyqueuosine reductase [Desulfobacteraceae bacterium]MBC2754024.1 epoxyqueuosine reductase [Desulfobacteraceae bacterium]
MSQALTEKVKKIALSHGADLVAIVNVSDLPEHNESITSILPTSQTVIVVAAKHSLAAIRSTNNQVAQFDTIHTYDACARAAHITARFLESASFSSAAVPAFIPIEMESPKHGMRGEICWRRAGVRGGLGSYGENGLLVTPEFGSAIRISGLVTSAELTGDSPLDEDVCDHCMKCIEACPAGALMGEGKINKKLCGDVIFKYGLRFFQDFIIDLVNKQPDEAEAVINSYGLREMWQTFMTGNYYYCYKCQSQCLATKFPR